MGLNSTLSFPQNALLPLSLSRLIRLCTKTNSISKGKAIHAQLITSVSKPDVQTINHLLTMYLKLGHTDYAQKLFEQMPERNLITWTTLISSYSQMGLSEMALNCLRSMVLDDGISPNNYTYVGAISACANMRAMRTGKEIHGKLYRTEIVNSFVNNCLVNFYGKCGLLKSARLVFDGILEPNTISWVSLIACHCQCGENDEGMRIFLRSLRMGVKVNEFSYGSVLGACAALEMLEVGMQLQCLAVKCGIVIDQYVVTGLVNFYAKCGELELACKAFKETDEPHLTAWTALVGGCVQLGKDRQAIDLFRQLLSTGLKPSEQTLASVLGAFANEKEVIGGTQLHGLIIKLGFDAFTFVCNAVLDFYAKSGHLEDSLKTFREMDARDIVSWNALIAGHVNSDQYEEAIRFIQNMSSEGFHPNLYTYSSLLGMCGDLPATEWGKQTHCCVIKPGFDSNVVVGSALVDMYAKCGRLDDAKKVFNILPNKNLVSWNSMIAGYAQHGLWMEALEIYDIMLKNGVKPNDITFIGVLSSCGHVGHLEEGMHHFNSMVEDFKIIPKTDHIACMVSLFARKGQMRGAYDFISRFSGQPDKVVWRSLLSGCITNKDLELGKYAAEKILSIDPDDTSAYITLSNIYADSKMWNETSQMRKLMKEKALKKEMGYSWIELHNTIYLFSAGHDMLVLRNGVVEVLSGLTAQLFDAGYVPDALVLLVDGY
ncbi:pentatricopeptide repeat-containing At3g53360, mitochondrial-like [Olea europaea subsp. europaea]|uniref:Pentatricopeptide repeat-containing At3g53360, mitochondrial-like n=1 Tax=Olea europaea subsp. europaea TaxID=158383 RepID=A0A8S0SDL4_OLEEU|nr:pentatricopeptide repeat-containing At3g53360, mitochondrial-like [Olea europaea subsp. europaea]